ncbi:MAG TPA: hypothetical protein VJ901_18275 [Thermoanaerobaculia bacterium]|nr:hypothetical protein [Thermoanaerobaculia bacterium]
MRSAVFVLALFALACPQGSSVEPSRTSTTASNPQAVPENSTAMNPVTESSKDSGGNRVTSAPPQVAVDLTEYSINMPDSLAAGPQQLQITNHGEQQHNFVIEGAGVHQQLASNLTRGGTATLDVDLKPGTYEVYCPVDEHKGKGMHRTITVK